MNRSGWLTAGGALLLVAGAGVLGTREGAGESTLLAATSAGAFEPAPQEGMIAFFEARAEADPYSAGDLAYLAQLYLQRARETGDAQYVERAEASARRSLELRTAHNSTAFGTLALSLVEQHRFTEALDAARQLAAADPRHVGYRALLGEIQLELGRYDEAAVTFTSLEGEEKDLDVAPRLARWHEIEGRPERAATLLEAARREAALRPELSAERRAWFHLRLGDFELRRGRLSPAKAAFEAGLRLRPGDHRLHAAMARLESARGRWDAAMEHAQEALGVAQEPGTLVLLSEIAEAGGHPGEALAYARSVEVALSAGEVGEYHRAESLFLLDRGTRVPEILRAARSEIDTRRDVYGWDLLAWSLHRAGRTGEARGAIERALERGTRDPLILYHAGMIERTLGEEDAARLHLREALEINPTFHPVHAERAREALGCGRGPRWLRRSPCR